MKKLLTFALCAFLAACSSDPRPDPIRLDYSSLGKIYLDSQDLRIIDRSKGTPQWSPYVGHLFKPTLADAVNRWAADRMQAVGQMGHATFIIKDASVTEQSLATASDFESLFTRQQASKYIGRIEVSVEAQSPSDGTVAMANANATHAITLPESPTETEKYEAYRKLLNALMAELNRNLDQSIHEHMSKFVLSDPSAARQMPADMMPPSQTQDSTMPRLMDE